MLLSAALIFLQQAMEAEEASLEALVRVADFLRKSEHDPGLRFEALGSSEASPGNC